MSIRCPNCGSSQRLAVSRQGTHGWSFWDFFSRCVRCNICIHQFRIWRWWKMPVTTTRNSIRSLKIHDLTDPSIMMPRKG